MPFPIPGRIAELLRRSTVQIRSGSGRQREGSGSGVVLNDGRIVTNAHVLIGGDATVETWDGKAQRARLAKTDPDRDLALLLMEQCDASAATLAAGEAKAGQAVIAVGNPMGFVGAVSTGFIYRIGAIRDLGVRRWIQADVRLAPGNSGGPLADINGQILGINSMVAGGLALSIPAASVQEFLSDHSQRWILGAVVRPVTFKSPAGSRQALLLLELTPNGPAERASLLPGDLLVNAANKPLQSTEDLALALSRSAILQLDFLRSGSTRLRRVAVQLAASPVMSAA
ncbi:MAG TPA: trypsin-like peptidase domain-containing protein [Bryobacteraceae bacterium]